MLVLEIVTWRNEKEQLHVISVCLGKRVVSGDYGNILPEFPNIAEQMAQAFFTDSNFKKIMAS